MSKRATLWLGEIRLPPRGFASDIPSISPVSENKNTSLVCNSATSPLHCFLLPQRSPLSLDHTFLFDKTLVRWLEKKRVSLNDDFDHHTKEADAETSPRCVPWRLEFWLFTLSHTVPKTIRKEWPGSQSNHSPLPPTPAQIVKKRGGWGHTFDFVVSQPTIAEVGWGTICAKSALEISKNKALKLLLQRSQKLFLKCPLPCDQ